MHGESAILRTTGQSPRPLFRFPFADGDARSLHAVNSTGYVDVEWTADTLGWMGTSRGQTVDSVVANAAAALRPGAILLMHLGANPADGSTLDAEALPRIITSIRGHGYRVVDLWKSIVSCGDRGDGGGIPTTGRDFEPRVLIEGVPPVRRC